MTADSYGSASMVQTVRGALPADRLGCVLAHEHVMTRSLGVAENYPSTHDRDDVIRDCVARLSQAREVGIDTVIDHTTFDIGRDPELLLEVSAASGVEIVACTGVWVHPPRFFTTVDVDTVAELFVSDVADGIRGTAIRAGIVKACLEDDSPSPLVDLAVRAAARAHRRTGVPLSTHTAASRRSGLALQDLLRDEGVDLGRVVIGHSGDTDDMDYLRALLQQGSYLGLDRFGVEDLLSDQKRAWVVAELCAAGWTDQLLLSHDATCWSGWRTEEQRRASRPNWEVTHIPHRVVPLLREMGLDEATLQRLLVGNPRRLFEQAVPY